MKSKRRNEAPLLRPVGARFPTGTLPCPWFSTAPAVIPNQNENYNQKAGGSPAITPAPRFPLVQDKGQLPDWLIHPAQRYLRAK